MGTIGTDEFHFNFGDREHRLLDDDSNDVHDDKDNILGVLSKPVEILAKQPSPVSSTISLN